MSDENAEKPGIDDSLLHEWAEHDCGPPKGGCNAAMRFEHGPRTHLARALLAAQSALAEARAEIERLRAELESDGQSAGLVIHDMNKRIIKLEAALAKVRSKPHSRSLSGINWIGLTDDELAALASPSEPVGECEHGMPLERSCPQCNEDESEAAGGKMGG